MLIKKIKKSLLTTLLLVLLLSVSLSSLFSFIPVVYATSEAEEGDYSNWTIYDSFDDADVSYVDVGQEAVVNKEETMIVIIDTDAKIIKNYNNHWKL